MTAMSIRHGLTTSPKFWAEHGVKLRDSMSASWGTRLKVPDTQALQRPDAKILNEAIPLVAIGRNRAGLWIARDCNSSFGRAFVFKGSAIRFAKRVKGQGGYALMFVNDGLELEPASTDTNQSPKAKVARLLIVWRAGIRRLVRRIRGGAAFKP
jgi:hypothetical protein